jgi:poly(A) polymerase
MPTLSTSPARQLRQHSQAWPPPLRAALTVLDRQGEKEFFFVGGTVRDALLDRAEVDLDLAVTGRARLWANRLRQELGGGALVDLCGPEDETFRVVWRGIQVDISAFRGGAATIDEDLRRRDFTINAMALPLSLLGEATAVPLIDPLGGVADLRCGLLRHCPDAFTADPARLLRAYRFMATLDFALAPETTVAITASAPLVAQVAAERLNGELRLIFASPRATAALLAMAEVGLLPQLLPELYRARGVVQPEFHQLDVFDHSVLTLAMMEKILADPAVYFPGQAEEFRGYLGQGGRVVALKWAALLHDIGKPPTRGEHPRQPGRITFYRHDCVGEELAAGIGQRLKWSRSEASLVAGLVAMHMQPFHLCNVLRGGGRLSRRAVLKLCRRAGGELNGLFLLAMADSLAGKGEKSPVRMEEEVAQLHARVIRLYQEHIRPVLAGAPLLTGRDLIETFGLTPGPLFARLLDGLATARVEGTVADRPAALAWVAAALTKMGETGAARPLVSSCQRKINGLQRA